MKAENITALAENGNNNHGFWSVDNATLVLCGAFLTGRGGTNAYGIYSGGSGTTLEAVSVLALGEDGSDNNYGLYNYESATATLRGGSFTGRGGQSSQGISNSDSGTTLEAENVTALAENGSNANYGLLNGPDNAAATLRGGSFTGRGGEDTYGIQNNGTLETENVTALGEDGSSENFGLYNLSGTATADSSQFTGSSNGLYLDGGTVYLGVSQLDGGATNSSGALTCFQVYDGSYSAYTCP